MKLRHANGSLSERQARMAMVVLMAGFVLLIVWSSFDQRSTVASVRNGELDLSAWEHAQQVLSLDGEWAFYWNELITPGQPVVRPPQYYAVPGNWQGKLGDIPIQAKGVASYRVTVHAASPTQVYGLRISNIRMASAVYVDGRLIGNSGHPSLDAQQYRFENKPYTVYFSIPNGSAEIVIHAANYDFVQGGIPHSIYFGTAAAIQDLDRLHISRSLLIVVSLAMLGVYHFFVYAMRRADKGPLYFGLYCISFSIAFSTNGDRVFMQFFDLPPELFYKIFSGSIFATLIFMAKFLKTMCADLIPVYLIRGTILLTSVYLLIVAVTPFRIYSHLNYPVGVLQVCFYTAVIFVLSLSFVRRRYGHFGKLELGLFILGLICYLIALVDFSLFIMAVDNNYITGYFGIMGYCMLMSLMLSYRFTNAFKTVENITLKLQESNRRKDQFLMQTSHEFQTPLNGVINLSQTLLEGASGPLNEQQQRELSIIKDTSKRLSLLVRDILDLEMLQRNELRVAPAMIDVKAGVRVVLELFRYMSASKNVRLIEEVPYDLPYAYADENRFAQVLYNLLGNALKFTARGKITITAEAGDGMITVFIEDSGIGIPPEQWSVIFESYERASPSVEQQYEGNGLGLFITRQLVSVMNGEVWVDWSKPGVGTRFAFTLPIYEERHTARIHDEAAAGHPSEPLAVIPHPRKPDRPTLLAVDDEPSNLQVLHSLFMDRYNILFAVNGQDALEVLNRESIDLVLLDVMMPGLSGYDVSRAIRSQYSLVEMPIIIMTVRHTSEDIAVGFESGANDYIVKPFDATEVRVRVETLLSLRNAVQDMIKIEMDFLRSQIKPHFLYNALNAILSFCRTEPARTEHLISQLAYYMRKSFDHSNGIFQPLQEELQLVHAYVEIEQARFEERLQYHLEVEEGLNDRMILPLTIQPLVENAIRHGIMKREDGGFVRVVIKTESDGDSLLVEVSDDGVGMPREKIAALLQPVNSYAGHGVGMINIHQRLLHFYGDGLTVSSVEGSGTVVSFRIRF